MSMAPQKHPDTVVLPPPGLPQDASLADALRRRHSTRTFLADPLTLEEISALLWSACGVNRRASGGHTAPSAHNAQETDVHLVIAAGAWRYDPREHRLLRVADADLRAATGLQDFVAAAPLNLVYVADFSRMPQARDDHERAFLAGAAAGAMAQNVYLHCAAAGLGTVVRGLLDRKLLARALKLAPAQRVTLAQTVGVPRV